LCFECVGEEFLQGEIMKNGLDGTCFYCGRDGKTFSIDQMADLVHDAIREFFTRDWSDAGRPGEGLLHIERRSIADVINDEAQTGADAAEDIRCVIKERLDLEACSRYVPAVTEGQDPFGPDAYYTKKETPNTWDFEGYWYSFEESLKTETRYFNRTAETILQLIFGGIDRHNTRSGRPIIVEAGPELELTMLYRARVFETKQELSRAMKRPDKHLGPPPQSLATTGRMNAAGIAVFYGATNKTVALAEVRPPVGSRVLIGGFRIIRPLKLLDLEALEFVDDEEGSIFDGVFVARSKRAQFLRGLSRLISRPVMPGDQPRDYLPTQAVATFSRREKIRSWTA
jgi:hypothetical protein